MAREGKDYECPECGSDFPEGTDRCPGCGVGIEWDEDAPEDGVPDLDERLERIEQSLGEGREGSERVFSRFGLAFAMLTLLAFFATVLVIRWDTLVQGAEVDTIGESQRLVVYAGAIATTVFALLSIIDVVWSPFGRGRRRGP
jgi:hypothetical protein